MRDNKGRFKQVYSDDLSISTSIALPRELKLNCTLTLKQISKIKTLYALGKTSRELAREFRVSKTTILYWVNGEEYRRKETLRRRNYENKNTPEEAKRYRERLKKLLPDLALKERVRVNKTRIINTNKENK